MEKYYLLSKKLISSKYSEDDKYYHMILIALTTLLYKYKDYPFLVEKIFNDTNIIIKNDSIRNILNNNNIEAVSFLEEDDIIDKSFCSTIGTSSLGYTFVVEDDKLIYFKEPHFIICDSRCNNTKLLNTFIHEFNHLIKSSFFDFHDNISYCIRCGIGYYKCIYNSEKKGIYEYNYYDTFDEVINVIETTEMMKNIKLLQVDDTGVLKYLNSLNDSDLSKDIGYGLCVNLIRPLWDNSVFKKLIEDNIIFGDINTIISSFDSILGNGSFEELADYLDELDYLDGFNKNKKRINILTDIIRNIVKEYNDKTCYQKSLFKN